MDFSRVSVFYLSSDGGDWALYLQHKFATKEYSLDPVLNDLMCDSSFHTRSSRLNVFLVTPNFLDSYVHFRYLEKFEKRNSILILTGIGYSDIEAEANSRECTYILDWMIHELKDGGEESVRDLMIKIIEVYEGHVENTSSGDNEDEEGKDSARLCDYDTLLILAPREVNKVLDIVQKGDIVYILLDKPPEVPITAKFPRESVTPEYLSKASVFRFNCTDVGDDEFSVVSDSIELSQGTLEDRRESQEVYCVPSNPRANVATQTDSCTEPVDETDNDQDNDDQSEDESDNNDIYDRIDEKLDKQLQGATGIAGRSKLEVINQILEKEAYPEKLLCKALGIKNDIEVLDDKLAGMIEGVEALRKLNFPSELHTTDASDQTVWPSLLHFGAQYNLKKFCTILARNSLVHRACAVPNKHGLKPNELAQIYGHTELNKMLMEIQTKELDNNAKCHDRGYDADADSFRASRASDSSEPEEPFPCTLSYEPSFPRQHTHEPSRQHSAIDRQGDSRKPSEHLSHSYTEPKYFAPKQQALSQSMPRTEVSLPTKPHKKGVFAKIFGHHGHPPKRQRGRRHSEPTILAEDLEKLNRNREEALNRNKGKGATMDISRVSVYYLSSDGGNWALYLQHKFATKEYSLETVLNDLMCDSSFHTRSLRLNVFLVTPNFLDSYVHFRYLEKFERRNSILILTGIDYADFKMEAQSRDCAYVMDWMIHELNDGGEESVRNLMIKIIEVYEGHGDFEEQGKGGARFSDYDTLPIVASRQVNKVLDIVQKGDIVYILLDRPPEGPITAKFPGKSITPEYLDEASVFRFDCSDVDDDEFTVVSDSIELSQGTLEDRRVSQEVYCVPSNPRVSVATQTDTGTEPETDISQVSVGRDEELYDNEDLYDRVDEPLDKQEVINQILGEEACPEKLLCKALEIENDIEVLDDKLAAMIEGVGELRNLSLLTEVQTTDDSDQTVWPSLLHFGAQYNLKKFCTILAGNRLIHRACAVPNKHGLKPNELAQKYGHTELAKMLLEIAESTYMYPIDGS